MEKNEKEPFNKNMDSQQNVDPTEMMEATMEYSEETLADVALYIGDTEEQLDTLRKKFSDFEEMLGDSRRIVSNVTQNLDSIRRIMKTEEERQRMNVAFNQATMKRSFEPQVASSTPQPFLNRPIPSKSYMDTRSEIAQEAISKAIGPLSPEQLTYFLDEVRYRRKSIYCVRQWTNDYASLLQQLKWVRDYLEESYKAFVKQPGNMATDFDRRLLQRLELLIRSIERI